MTTDPSYRGIFAVARRVPGLVVPHDTRLQHFFASYTEAGTADRAFHVEAMARRAGRPPRHGSRAPGAEPALPLDERSLDAHLIAVRRRPQRFTAAGRRGREVLERLHSPAAYAAGLVQAARESMAGHARRQAIDLARVAVGHMMDIQGGPPWPVLQDSVARAIVALTGSTSR
ncbi:conserved protein of unknown function [Rhodovastum atsumiense]|uniref:Uncharacterized protein n=1 Tax=Rhodovastum atsumiense TaxID=504468 RepID=A0A5M6IP10_9PROT|nr:hypothetical protein [Rhodovastum atsumiense]KAA5609205.1 hypothetical protein F1189_25250 [Rhodovastum atsumiense]CAH2603967.1 conserved protein of unknown function [Rhodovastum atsumiense]